MCLKRGHPSDQFGRSEDWILNRNIHRLEDEPDRLIARNPRDETAEASTQIHDTAGERPAAHRSQPRPVRVVGGGYFFLPSRSALRYLSGGVLGKLHDVLPGPR